MQPLTNEDRAVLGALKKEDFDCLPLRDQIRYFCDFVFDRGDTVISIADYRELFDAASLTSPRSGKPVQPTASQIRAILVQLELTGDLPFALVETVCVIPWVSLHQDWVFRFHAPTGAKAEALAQRLNSKVQGPQPFIPRLSRTNELDAWSAGTSVRLRTRSWPCAVAEALRNGNKLSAAWRYQGDGRHIAIAITDRSNQPALLEARWEIRIEPKRTSADTASTQLMS